MSWETGSGARKLHAESDIAGGQQMGKQVINRRRFLLAGAASFAMPALSSLSFAQNLDCDVAIVGAGLSGLNAARHLEAEGLRVQLLEAQDRVGGRVFSLQDMNGVQEVGGQSIGIGYARMVDATDSLGLERYSPGATNAVLRRRGTGMFYRGQSFSDKAAWTSSDLNPFDGDNRSQYPWERLRALIGQLNPVKNAEDWLDAGFHAYDVSLATALKQAGIPDDQVKLMTDINPTYGDGGEMISAMMHFYNAAWIRRQFAFIEPGTAPTFQVKGGNQRIPIGMAAGLKNEVRHGFNLVSASSVDGHIRLKATDGQTVRAKAVVMTLPLQALSKIDFDNSVPAARLDAFKAVPYSRVYQGFFEIEKPFWEEDGLPLTCWSDTPAGRLFVAAGADDSPAYLKSWSTGLAAKRLDGMPDRAALELLQAEIHRIRPSTKGAIKPARTWSWQQNRFAGGTYAAWAPGQISSITPAIGAPVGNIFFAGEHTAQLDRGMEGAMESGERAAFEVLERL